MDPEVRIAYMTSDELADVVRERPTAIVPTGSTEVLGRHGTLGVDTIVGDNAGRDIAARTGSLVAPTIPYGDALELRHWPGTVSIRPDVLTGLYTDVAESLLAAGFKRLFFLNIHSMNSRSVDRCCRLLRSREVAAASGSFWQVAMQEAQGLTVDTRSPNGHGGEVITSVAMALDEQSIRLADAANEQAKPGASYYFSHLPGGGSPFSVYGDFTDYCESGAWGDVSAANAETGLQIYRRSVDRFVDFLNEFNERPFP